MNSPHLPFPIAAQAEPFLLCSLRIAVSPAVRSLAAQAEPFRRFQPSHCRLSGCHFTGCPLLHKREALPPFSAFYLPVITSAYSSAFQFCRLSGCPVQDDKSCPLFIGYEVTLVTHLSLSKKVVKNREDSQGVEPSFSSYLCRM